MKRLPGISMLIVIALICGCKPAVSTSTGTPLPPRLTITPLPPDTLAPTLTEISPSPTDLLESTLTETPQTISGYQQDCLQIETTMPPGFLSKGAIILSDEDANGNPTLSALFTSDNSLLALPASYNTSQIVSPDGKRLAEEVTNNGNNGQSMDFLELLSAEGQKQGAIPYDQNWIGPLYWLDTKRIVLDDPPSGEVVANIIAGQLTRLDYSSPTFSVYNKTIPVYDPTLTRMVYQRNAPMEFVVSLVLWDLQFGRELWHADIGDGYWAAIQPRWSPDGSRFAVGIPPEYDAPIFQLFVVDRDGKAKQLTHFQGPGYPELDITQPQWSPDSRYIAFWFAGSLTVFDTVTETATDYCLPSDDAISTQPHWSPDSQQIVFEQEGDPEYVVVVDIQKKRAVEVAKTYTVIGWMKTSP